jgi:hypothetical protein
MEGRGRSLETANLFVDPMYPIRIRNHWLCLSRVDDRMGGQDNREQREEKWQGNRKRAGYDSGGGQYDGESDQVDMHDKFLG